MIYQQNCNNLNVKYYDDLIKIDIESIKNNFEKFKIYENILQIFKLNKVNMIIKFKDVEYIIFSDKELNKYFQKFYKYLIILYYFENMRHPINSKYLNLDMIFLAYQI